MNYYSWAFDTSLEEHDKRFHPEGFQEGDSCKFRDQLKTESESDNLVPTAERKRYGYNSNTSEDPIRLVRGFNSDTIEDAVHGNWTYMSDDSEMASYYAEEAGGWKFDDNNNEIKGTPHVVEFTLKPGANIVSSSTVDDILNDEGYDHDEFFLDYDDDSGRLLADKGIDGFIFHDADGNDIWVITNPNAITSQTEITGKVSIK